MIARALLSGLLVGCLAAGGVARADPMSEQTPFAMVRTLQILQEQIARGNGMAQAAQPRLLDHMAERFLAADLEVWREPRNARAAILFLFSGGKPSVIRSILAKTAMPVETDKLLKGALAYAEGNDEIARRLLLDIEPRSLPSGIGGHLALVQASLLSGQDGAKASKLLDIARLLVPGTLVEEAALRRQVFVVASPDTFDKFVYLSRQYIRRYRTSTYAGNFKQRLTSMAASLAASGDVVRLAKLDAVIAEMPPSEQIGFYLTIAKTAIVEGKSVAARLAAERAAALAGDQGIDGARSKLYAAAALIVSDDTAKGIDILRSLDQSRLTAQDAELRDAALAVGSGVRATDPDPTAGRRTPEGDTESAALLQRARSAVSESDKLLGGKSP